MSIMMVNPGLLSQRDPFFANAVSLMHFNGAAGEPTYTDVKGKIWGGQIEARTWTAGGNAQLDTSQSLFGTSSLLLDGTGDYVQSGDEVGFEPGAGDFTIELAFRYAALVNPAPALLSKYRAGSSGRSWILSFSATNLTWAWSTSGGVAPVSLNGATTWNPNQWYRVAVSRVGATWYLFKDGVLLTSGAAATPANTTAPVLIGAQNSSGVPDNLFSGWIDELRFTKGVGRYTANYTPAAAAFPNLILLDASYASVTSLIHFEGANGSTTITESAGFPGLDTSQSVFGGSSIYFDGTNAIGTPDSVDFEFGTGDFTIEAAVRCTDLSVGNCIISKYTSSLNNRSWIFNISSTGIRFAYDLNGGGIDETVLGAFTFLVNTWYRVAVTRVGTTIYLFSDGVLLGSSSAIGTSSIFGGTAGTRIGSFSSSGIETELFKGWIDELRVTKGVGRYSANYTPSTVPFPDS